MTSFDAALATSMAKLSVKDTLAVFGRVVVPTLGKGVFVRRPRMVSLAERFQLDAGAVRCLQRLRRQIELARPSQLRADRPLPATLDNFNLRFDLAPAP